MLDDFEMKIDNFGKETFESRKRTTGSTKRKSDTTN